MVNASTLHLSEAAIVQNEAIGSFALWKFGLAFQARDGCAVTLPLLYLILPLIMHEKTLNLILGTRKASGLHLFVGKLNEKREDLLSVHSRAMTLRQLTLSSLILGEQSGLLRIEPSTAEVWANSVDEEIRIPVLPERIRRITPACERLGHWFAGLSDQQIAHTLKVEF
ncbi:three component ABC system middle component [Vreelandella nigrificans]|uniref:Uncharacterized protein n=1 Tax=Vreelandella nigrificans TaxID=2042704 RepID=A0A2A4HN53_9GAMM|nr:three component ABC system middle component [Halomonas nigrificans]PCF96332.1 hypothetical protein CPA45_07295 [Halomonas nigrificans]